MFVWQPVAKACWEMICTCFKNNLSLKSFFGKWRQGQELKAFFFPRPRNKILNFILNTYPAVFCIFWQERSPEAVHSTLKSITEAYRRRKMTVDSRGFFLTCCLPKQSEGRKALFLQLQGNRQSSKMSFCSKTRHSYSFSSFTSDSSLISILFYYNPGGSQTSWEFSCRPS